MEILLRSKEYWHVVDKGFVEPIPNKQVTAMQQKNLDEMKLKLKDLKAHNYLFQSTDKYILKTIIQKVQLNKFGMRYGSSTMEMQG